MCIKLIIIFIFFFSFCDPVSRTEVTRLVEEFTSAFSFSGRVNNARGSRVAREAPKQEAKRSHYHEYAGSKAITSPWMCRKQREKTGSGWGYKPSKPAPCDCATGWVPSVQIYGLRGTFLIQTTTVLLILIGRSQNFTTVKSLPVILLTSSEKCHLKSFDRYLILHVLWFLCWWHPNFFQSDYNRSALTQSECLVQDSYCNFSKQCALKRKG